MPYTRLSPGVYRNTATGQLVKSATMPVDPPKPISPGGMVRKPVPPAPVHSDVGRAPINTNNSVAGLQNVLNQQKAQGPQQPAPPAPSPNTSGVDPNAGGYDAHTMIGQNQSAGTDPNQQQPYYNKDMSAQQYNAYSNMYNAQNNMGQNQQPIQPVQWNTDPNTGQRTPNVTPQMVNQYLQDPGFLSWIKSQSYNTGQ